MFWKCGALWTALVAAGAVAAAQSCDSGNMNSMCNYTEQRPWDYMMFVQTWQGTFCRDGCCKLPAGVAAVHPGFTIHGMWPNYYGPGYPSCCAGAVTHAAIDAALAASPELKAALDVNWPAFKKCEFVHYETEKHGTCAVDVYNGTTGLQDYWSAAMGLLLRWDMAAVLARAGIVPSATNVYTVADIKAAVHDAVGATVNLACDSANPRLLAEIRMCLRRPQTLREKFSPVPIDCPDITNNCKASHVELPPLPVFKPGDGCTK